MAAADRFGHDVPMVDVDSYLRRLDVAHPGPPSVQGLITLQRAHVSRIPYETLEIQLGRRTTVDPDESAARIVAGRGGYCYHLNGAFAALLEALGYHVRKHLGGVFGAAANATGANGNHLALTVDLDGEQWFIDAGLGDALYDPIPLHAGEVTQGPFTYRLEPSPLVVGGWRFWHSPVARSFEGMDFAPEPVTMAAFAGHHRMLSTATTSNFVRVPQVGRRTSDGVDFLRAATFRHVDAAGLSEHVLTSADEWFGVIAEVFGMPLDDLDVVVRDRLWDRIWASHLDHVGARQASDPAKSARARAIERPA
jgi:arylamine N-acetyltransferase